MIQLELNLSLPEIPFVLETHGDQVRRILRDGWVVVQQLVNGDWVDAAKFNEVSNGYAHTQSAAAARRLAHTIMRTV